MRRITLVIVVALALVAVLSLLRPIRSESGARATTPSAALPPVNVVVSPAPARAVVVDAAPLGAATAVDTVDFADAVAKLVVLSLRGNDELARGEIEKAKATDAEGVAVTRAVLEFVPDYEARAMFALTGSTGSDERATMTRRVIERFLFFGLQKLATLAKVRSPEVLDTFVLALLEALLLGEHIADVVVNLLAGQPYLGVRQETEVMRLIELVPTHPWLAEPMRKLLLTLWRNLEASGTRPRDSLETMALMLKDDTNPARRAAAIERLMLSGDRNLVDFVVRDIEEQRDATRAADLAAPAASQLSPDLAVEVVGRLRAVAGAPLTVAAIELARRDGKLTRATFEALAAANRDAEYRADLVMGLGCNPSRDNLAVVKAAFQRDPDPRVRARALLAITGNAATALGEEVVTAALADRGLCGPTGEGLGVIVAALENLASQGERDTVTRLGAQLGQRQDLPPPLRSQLERLLAEGPANVRVPRKRKG